MCFVAEDHKFYVSKCTINYAVKQKSLQVSLNVFIDDLELALSKRGYTGLFIATEKEDSLADERIFAYLNEKFVLQNTDTRIELQYLGKELSEDMASLWCYLEAENVTDLSTMTIKNEILTEVFDEQKNLVFVEKNNKSKDYFMLYKGKTTAKTNF